MSTDSTAAVVSADSTAAVGSADLTAIIDSEDSVFTVDRDLEVLFLSDFFVVVPTSFYVSTFVSRTTFVVCASETLASLSIPEGHIT